MAISKITYKASPNATPETWMDSTGATASAADIVSPKTAMLADGIVTPGTGTAPTGTKQISITQNGTTTEDVAAYANAEITVNVSGGGGTDFLALRCNNDTPFSYFSEEVTNLSASSFRDAKQLTCLVLPNLVTIQNAAYICAGCSNLEAMDIGSADSFPTQFFYSDSALRALILRKSSSLVGMRSTNAVQLSSMASGGAGCTIYIPKALYDHLGDGTALDYQAATNWSIIHGYGTITWAQIEGSIYETQYADGTPIP